MDSMDVSRLRTEYANLGLDESEAGDDPVSLFARWLDDAMTSGIHEPNAMALATATADGQPSVRTVLLKGVDERGWVFYTNFESRKGVELDANPRAAATMLWHPLHRQVRIEGGVERVEDGQSDAYFAARPRGAQISAVASPQSQVVMSREALDELWREAEDEAGEQPVDRPDDWGGYRISWDVVEFWQGRQDRFHDRLRFTRTDDGWECERLAP